MNHQLHTLFRALVDYRKVTLEDKDCKTQRNAIIIADSETDLIEITRKNCIIEEDWIEAIERGLEFIEKAIKEERQFIRSNGEVIPIEKVKRTSKDSVEHLAKHANLITREPEEGEDIIPDQLYTVERLSDYTVYENRFLYMLLCYLRDFISIRYEKIVELTNTYNGKLFMSKTIVESNRRVKYEVKLEEEKKNDDYLRENNSAQSVIDRILTIYKAVIYFLNTPLMIEVAKVAMLKPPITRTNVLKMNRNFREALSLYEYVSAYDKDGYTIETQTKTISPFVGVVADELAEVVELSSFLTYEHGLGIKKLFKRQYDKEEELKKEEEQRKFAEQLKNIGRHLKESGLSAEEYISMLEKRIRDLENKDDDLMLARKTIDELHVETDRLTAELGHAKGKINSLYDEINELNFKYNADMEAESIRHAEEIEELNENHEREISELHSDYADKIDEIKTMHQDEVDAINEAHESEVNLLTSNYEEKIDGLNAEISECKETISSEREKHIEEVREIRKGFADKEKEFRLYMEEKKDEIKDLNRKCERLEDMRILSEARLNALRSEYGLMTEKDDFSTKEMTDEIEHQYIVFKKFFRTEWKQTKKKLRQEYLWKKKHDKHPETQPVEDDALTEEKSVEQEPLVKEENVVVEEINTLDNATINDEAVVTTEAEAPKQSDN